MVIVNEFTGSFMIPYKCSFQGLQASVCRRSIISEGGNRISQITIARFLEDFVNIRMDIYLWILFWDG